MGKFLTLSLALLLLLGSLIGCGTAVPTTVTTAPVTLNVSAAASLTNALKEINALYTQLKPWVTITPNYASSGTLQTQIENGAPCDVFLSAAATQMDNLQNENLLLAGSRKNLLNNKIVLIVPKSSTLGITGFSDLTLPKVKLIAIGDPKSVPAGTYAQQAFTELGMLAAIQSKFVLGATVPQVLQYVDGGNVDAGVVFATDALSDSNVTVVATGPADVNAGIVYPVAIIKASKNADAAQDYVNFLSSAQAKAVFEKFGFTLAAK
ncbi:MAG: molybdate ABC transporter substrate-binding protein [Dehalococcoidia bacterium]|nr:MAG: molybdate ABC transporter substrate-binding protein [Dehalococcoidia bacterium]